MSGLSASVVRIAAFMFLLLFFSGMAYADTCSDWVARLDSFQGRVQAKRSGSAEWRQVDKQESFCAGDMLRIMEKSLAVVLLKNETVLRLGQNTAITIAAATGERPTLLDLLKGAAYFISRTPQKFRVNTPFLNAGIEGTEFAVSVSDKDATVTVLEGIVTAENRAGSIRLLQGQSATAAEGRAPVLAINVRPKDAVQWTLHYPLLSIDPASESFTSRIASLLSSGAAAEAEAELKKRLSAEPNNADALSFMSVVSVARNDKSEAMDYAARAVSAAPNSAKAHIALSYARQAAFDLEAALRGVQRAAELEPENGLVWARMSELYLSLGRRDEALQAAEKASSHMPGLSRTQSVLGFSYLSQIRMDEAMAAFEKAAGLDAADPLPRLGLGPAKIRKGQLKEGRREIEVAMSLDTGNALIRSYLGKGYYEEKRDSIASDQFSMAKEADPNDPTAFFYSALQKQTQNRPVEALQDLERSMALNDNRAVYRSRLMLDEDQAARGAGLARIYSDLGFEQLALAEGYKSVNADPANASAHRFLSDSYAALPRHEIARVSELLQAQILQPVGINPVQPHLAEPGLFILQGAGPSDAGFNEYNSLFDRNRISIQASGLTGGNSTLGNELVLAGLHDKVSFSFGQFHYKTDGFRENNDQKQNIYNVFGQLSITPRTSVQVEYRSRDMKNGYLPIIFDPDLILRDYREKRDIESVRLGLHHSFLPGSDLIVSVIHADTDLFYALPGISEETTVRGYLAEAQHLFRSGRFTLISGFGYNDEDYRSVADYFNWPSTTDSNPTHTNLYTYAHLKPVSNITVTLGASADFFKRLIFDQDINREQFNPKFGLLWNLTPETTLRAAAFRTLRRSLLTDQTIEPTQVAGFNQFFNDTEGTSSWRYGLGIDHELAADLYAGAEFSKRDLEVLGIDLWSDPPSLIEATWKEQLGRAYLYWSPHKWLALSAEYQYELFERPLEFAGDNITRLSTNKLILGGGFHHPSGFSARIETAFVDQKGTFIGIQPFPPFGAFTYKESDRFWIANASLHYRLPKRTGIISLEAKNLFNERFRFQDTDPRNPGFYPERLVLAKFTLAF